MRATNACDRTLSAEHLVSEGVLNVLAEGEVTVTGAHWLNGETKTLPFSALKARDLCRKHNSALSPIDTAGADFFRAVQDCGTTASGPPLHFLLSGHDVERWLLRTLAIFGVSRNFAIDGAAIEQELVERLRIVDLLEGFDWPRPLGLYLLGGQGHQFDQRSDVQLAPILRRDTGALIGITVNIQGLALGLLATEHDLTGTSLDRAFYRPRSIVFDMGAVQHRIQLCWEDRVQHQDVTMTLKQPGLILGQPTVLQGSASAPSKSAD